MLGALTLLGLEGCERYALDTKMALLCNKNGGIKVYETVELSPTDFDAVTGYRGGGDWKNRESFYGPNFRFVEKEEILVGTPDGPLSGRGRLSRHYSAIYRRSDNKLLGESIIYGRTGGDLFTFGMGPSSSVCPRLAVDLSQSVFKKG